MKIKNIGVKNFRLLFDVSINLEDDTTLVIGRNNSGKTSLFSILKIFLKDSSQFCFEDFSTKSYNFFSKSYEVFVEYTKKKKEQEIDEKELEKLQKSIQETIPKIELIIEFEYDKDKPDSLANLSSFIVDLDPDRNDALIKFSFSPVDSLKLFEGFDANKDEYDGNDDKSKLIAFLQKNIKGLYREDFHVLDKKSDYTRKIERGYKTKLEKLFLLKEIKAQRDLDDDYKDNKENLSKGFSSYYSHRDRNNTDVEDLESELIKIRETLRQKYGKILKDILKDLSDFGAETPTRIPEIFIESEMDSQEIIRKNIKYLYKNESGVNLPERYNGLGYSNLIFMVLELASFIEEYKNQKEQADFMLVLIEEPEVHMHPQMQQVFIKNINNLLSKSKKENNLTYQVLITTHSSHIISEAGIDEKRGFSRIRYFNTAKSRLEVNDFSKDFKIEDDDGKTYKFLKQYLTIHKCDLFFADKIILIEGVTERMLLPKMISKQASSLNSEYISVLEVGGAHAKRFKELLEFIGVRTLIITDLDFGKEDGEKVEIEQATKTTNQTLIKWLPQKEKVTELLNCKIEEKLSKNKLIRVAYQVNEEGENPRSFEEAFILKNRKLIEDNKNDFGKTKVMNLDDLKKKKAFEIAPTSSKGKINFAFNVMLFEEDWSVPNYISEGLKWLANEN